MIPFVDLKLQHAAIRGEIDAAIRDVIDRCDFTLGRDVAAFEEEFAAYCSTAYGVAVNTGTSALHLALLAAGVGPGDEGGASAATVCITSRRAFNSASALAFCFALA